MIVKKEEISPIDFDGLSILDYTASIKEKSSFAVITVPPKVSHRVSWSRRSDKYYYVVQARVMFTINDEKRDLKAGDFCLIKKGETFSYVNEGSETATLILVHTPSFRLDKEVFR